MKHACLARLEGEFPVRLMCRLLGVAPAGYYKARRRGPSARATADQRLRLAIRAEHRASHRRYGAPKIHAELQARGIKCGRNRVARLMREDGLCGSHRRSRRTTTTHSVHNEPVATNVLARRFDPADLRERDRVWVADITYVPTAEGWLYLAVVLDLASRRVVGWAAADHLGHGLAVAALEQAVARRRPLPGLLHHSDRGIQYACPAYQAVLRQHGMVGSMSRVGDCWDNAVAESFFATLKTELVGAAQWPTRAAARRALAAYIDCWYNHQRRHAALGYRSPVEYERELARLRVA